MKVSQKQKSFSRFFSAFLKSRLNFEHFQTKGWISWLMYFRNYGLRKTRLHQCLKRHLSTDLSETNMVNATKYWRNLQATTFTIFIDHCECNWLGKTHLVICKISRLFPNTLSPDGKYSLLNKDNLTQSIQTQLSRKQKTFSDFFLHFWNLVLILKFF